MGSSPGPSSPSTISTSCRTASASRRGRRSPRGRAGARGEHLPTVHPPARSDVPAHGSHRARGRGGLSAAARLGAARGGLPHHPGRHLLPGCEPRRDGFRRHRAARAAVRTGARLEPDDLDELGWQLGHHPAVLAQPRHRRRRAGGPGGDQCRTDVPAQRSAGPAGLQQIQSGGCSDPDARADLEDRAALEGAGSGGYAAGTEDLAAARGRSGQHQRRPEARRADPGEPHHVVVVRPRPRGGPHRRPRHQHRPAQGQLRWSAAIVPDRGERSAAVGCRLPPGGGRVPERSARAALGRRDGRRRRGELETGRMDERRPGHHPQRPAPAGREHHPGRRPRHEAPAAAEDLAPLVHPDVGPDRSHRDHPGIRPRRAVRAHAHHRAGGDGDFPVLAHSVRHRHPQHRGSTVAGGDVRGHVPARVQPQQSDADGAHDLDGLRRGRRHRDDRERRRPALPGIRRDARGHHPPLRGRVAHADADALREAPARPLGRKGATAAGRLRADVPARGRILREDARVGARTSDRHPLRGGRDAGADGGALHGGAEGFLPGPGHRCHPGHLGSARRDLLRGDGGEAAGACGRRPPRPGCREHVLVHRGRRNEHHAEQRPHADQLETARGAQARSRAGDAPPPGRAPWRAGHHALPATGAGPHHRGSGQPDAVPVHAGRPRRGRARHLGCAADQPAETAAGAERRRERSTDPRIADLARGRSGDGIAPGDHAAGDRRRALRRLRPAPGVDAVHPDQPVPRGARGGGGLPERARQAAGHLRPGLQRTGAPQRVHPCGDRGGAARHQPPGPVPGGDHFVQRGAGGIARRRYRRRRACAARAGDAAGHPGDVPRHRPGLPRITRERAAPHPRGARGRLHRPGGALRELHPSVDDPLDPSLGWGRRDPRPDDLPGGAGCGRAHRHHPADRDREEERHHDGRLRARGRAEHGRERARGSPSSRAAAVPADHDDHDGRAPRRTSSRAGDRTGLGAAPAARDCHRGRIDAQPAAHALHDARHLRLLRSHREEAFGGASRPGAADGARAGGIAMSLSSPFIRRPVATVLLTAAVALAGGVAFTQLPVSPLPQIDFPTITVQTALPGASPEIMASSVATPLERQFGRIAGVTEMTSTSYLGSTTVTLQFDLGRNIDAAARDVEAAINAARGNLPANLPSNPRYRKVNPADSPILILALTSKIYDRGRLYDLASTILEQRLSQIPGVGQVVVGGSSLPAVRVELNPTQLNAYGLGLEDVRSVLGAQNVNRPKGQFADGTSTSDITANDQLLRAADYAPLIVSYRSGAAVKLSDVASVQDGVEDVRTAGNTNGMPAVLVVVSRQPGANIIDTVDRVRAALPQLAASIPSAIQWTVVLDQTTTIRASVREVERTLLASIALVVLVVFVFLRNGRATLIPSVAVPVSLIGTFAVMFLCGYTLDNLSLMALTVATGFVVDDAIVVSENVVRYIEQGVPPMEAALKGAREIGFTVLSVSVSLVAVFTPILLMGGIVGRLFREFAVTLSVAILVSLVVSLTTTPMMCAWLLKHRTEQKRGRAYRITERVFSGMLRAYERSLAVVLRHPALTIGVLLLTVGANVYAFAIVPKGFFPQQDTGRLNGAVQAQQDTSFQAMQGRMNRFVDIIKTDPAVANVLAFTGGPGGPTNTGRVFVTLKPLDERGVTADQIIARLRPKLAKVPGGTLYLQSSQDLRVGAVRSNAQYQYSIQSGNLADLTRWGPTLLTEMRKLPQLTDVSSDQQN